MGHWQPLVGKLFPKCPWGWHQPSHHQSTGLQLNLTPTPPTGELDKSEKSGKKKKNFRTSDTIYFFPLWLHWGGSSSSSSTRVDSVRTSSARKYAKSWDHSLYGISIHGEKGPRFFMHVWKLTRHTQGMWRRSPAPAVLIVLSVALRFLQERQRINMLIFFF